KEQPLVIADKKVLWSIIPKKVIFTYVKDEALKNEARALIKEDKFIQSLFFKGDAGLKRRLYFMINQHHYVKKYKESFGNKGLH
ncbi:MAG: ATP-grasp domain-containing protein, partial [Lachnospiraceae bacterium]|nr:ATP-grasp domain-containing protein [Lachnospiraceae bacterium]